MSKHAKGHKHTKSDRPDPTKGVRAKPAYFMIFVVALVVLSVLAIVICSGTWAPW